MRYTTCCTNCGWAVHASGPVNKTIKCKRCTADVVLNFLPELVAIPNIKPLESVVVVDREAIKEAGRKAWDVLHSMETATVSDIARWIKNHVPSYGCGCASFAVKYLQENPPPSGSIFKWGWEFHCAVDAKVGDTPMSFDEACTRWNRSPQA